MADTLLLVTSDTLKGNTTPFSPLNSNSFPSTLTEALMKKAETKAPQEGTQGQRILKKPKLTEPRSSKAPTTEQ